PDVTKTYVAKDPQNFHYWYSPTGFMALLIMNTTKPPFDDPVVRKAISMAINRDQVVKIGMADYTHPATDATGLSDSVASWRDPSAIPAGGDWTKFDVATANANLD